MAASDGDDERTRAATDATALFEGLAHPLRRHLLAVLTARESPIDERELATRVAARKRGTRPSAVTDDERRSVQTTLHHSHLPKLASLGLVDHDADAGRVAATVSRDLEASGLLDADADEALFDALAADRRRTVLAVLRARPERDDLAVEDLAAAVAERDGDRDDGPAAVLLQLHHRHLPKLDDAGLVDHDAGGGTVTYLGLPELAEEWVTLPASPPTSPVPASRTHGRPLDD